MAAPEPPRPAVAPSFLHAHLDPPAHAVDEPDARGAPQVVPRQHALGDLAPAQKLAAESPRQQPRGARRREAPPAFELDDHVAVGELGQLAAVVPEQHVVTVWAVRAPRVVNAAPRRLVAEE